MGHFPTFGHFISLLVLVNFFTSHFVSPVRWKNLYLPVVSITLPYILFHLRNQLLGLLHNVNVTLLCVSDLTGGVILLVVAGGGGGLAWSFWTVV